ncbi:hypothetical protein VPH35_093630 [Triticum aestivum]|uniref:Uncharacterized protein n=1 Tax=Triticum turgidum subsp. durum TaxID=4567 RepID=A0A9R0XLF3_TRITD|nr:unnamed protein product [Triticum turgidum subsp. durum]
MQRNATPCRAPCRQGMGCSAKDRQPPWLSAAAKQQTHDTRTTRAAAAAGDQIDQTRTLNQLLRVATGPEPRRQRNPGLSAPVASSTPERQEHHPGTHATPDPCGTRSHSAPHGRIAARAKPARSHASPPLQPLGPLPAQPRRTDAAVHAHSRQIHASPPSCKRAACSRREPALVPPSSAPASTRTMPARSACSPDPPARPPERCPAATFPGACPGFAEELLRRRRG